MWTRVSCLTPAIDVLPAELSVLARRDTLDIVANLQVPAHSTDRRRRATIRGFYVDVTGIRKASADVGLWRRLTEPPLLLARLETACGDSDSIAVPSHGVVTVPLRLRVFAQALRGAVDGRLSGVRVAASINIGRALPRYKLPLMTLDDGYLTCMDTSGSDDGAGDGGSEGSDVTATAPSAAAPGEAVSYRGERGEYAGGGGSASGQGGDGDGEADIAAMPSLDDVVSSKNLARAGVLLAHFQSSSLSRRLQARSRRGGRQSAGYERLLLHKKRFTSALQKLDDDRRQARAAGVADSSAAAALAHADVEERLLECMYELLEVYDAGAECGEASREHYVMLSECASALMMIYWKERLAQVVGMSGGEDDDAHGDGSASVASTFVVGAALMLMQVLIGRFGPGSGIASRDPDDSGDSVLSAQAARNAAAAGAAAGATPEPTIAAAVCAATPARVDDTAAATDDGGASDAAAAVLKTAGADLGIFSDDDCASGGGADEADEDDGNPTDAA